MDEVLASVIARVKIDLIAGRPFSEADFDKLASLEREGVPVRETLRKIKGSRAISCFVAFTARILLEPGKREGFIAEAIRMRKEFVRLNASSPDLVGKKEKVEKAFLDFRQSCANREMWWVLQNNLFFFTPIDREVFREIILARTRGAVATS